MPSLATNVAQPRVAALHDCTWVWPAGHEVWLAVHVHTSPVVQQTPLGSEQVVLLPVKSRAQWHVVEPSPEQVTCVQAQ